MAEKLNDIIQGDTVRWRLNWPTDITGATVQFILERLEDQATPDLALDATLDAANGDGDVLGASFEITPAQSASLAKGNYNAGHKITLANGDVCTFLKQRIRVEDGLGL
ncbi:MAG: hypothetical protein OET90_02605 [Desulfuromonadales bacterium]|nr:hypothetical protein [Desulfuromonadales bacterium]